jgi:hypothetical protein
MKSDRLSYLLYRCQGCKRLLTRLEIIESWERSESTGVRFSGICPCGSGKIGPTNAKLWEELFLPRVWKLWWYEVFLPKLAR